MPSSKKKTTNTIKWLAVWDCLGLESLWNITEIEQARLVATLKEERLPNFPPLHALVLRAKANPQRNYEIYLFNSVKLDETQIKEMFEKTPQVIVDFIRNNGVEVYNNRFDPSERKIV